MTCTTMSRALTSRMTAVTVALLLACAACDGGGDTSAPAGSTTAGAAHAAGATAGDAGDATAGTAGTAASVTAAAACSEHGVSRCPFCVPALLTEMGFCGGHRVPEAICTRCRDDLEQAFRSENDWCDEHRLPESQCEACSPGALDEYETYRTSRADPARDPSSGHPDPFRDAPDAQPITVARDAEPRARRAPALSCSTDASTLRLADAAVAEHVGIRTERVARSTLRRTLEAPATVEYDARAYARLAPRAEGIVVEVLHDLGDDVEQGAALVVVDSVPLGAAKAELLQALARRELWQRNSERKRGLLGKSLSTEQDVLEAEARLAESRIALAAAQQRLRNLGLGAEQIEAIGQTGDVSSLLTVRAPFASTVVQLDAVIGELASPGAALVAVADTSRMWVILDVDQADIRFVELGRPVLLAVPGWIGETLGGTVSWISSDVDPRTRTVKVRAELDNPEHHLRAKSFATARLVTRDDEEVVLVPKDAVQWEGCCNVAFERVSPTEFVPRKLRLGYDTGEHYEVLAGLGGGEPVVTQGSFLLKTELQKGSIGAGCCEIEHLGG